MGSRVAYEQTSALEGEELRKIAIEGSLDEWAGDVQVVVLGCCLLQTCNVLSTFI